jgi:hypothetical protein
LDLESEMNQLQKADRDIVAGRARVDRQRALVLHLESGGHDIESAVALLKSLQGALEAMEAHRVLIQNHVEQLRRKEKQMWKQPGGAASS